MIINPFGFSAPRILGLYSPAPQMGKLTVAAYLEGAFRYERVRLASGVKRMAAVLLHEIGVHPNQMDAAVDGELKEAPLAALGFPELSSRKLQKLIGTEFGRNLIDPDLWLKIAARKIDDAKGFVVIEDVRFKNEFDMVKARGGEVWHVSNPRVPIIRDGHPSEGGLDGELFDNNLVNDGTIIDLQAKVTAMLRGASHAA